jgi:hypothetical protein
MGAVHAILSELEPGAASAEARRGAGRGEGGARAPQAAPQAASPPPLLKHTSSRREVLSQRSARHETANPTYVNAKNALQRLVAADGEAIAGVRVCVCACSSRRVRTASDANTKASDAIHDAIVGEVQSARAIDVSPHRLRTSASWSSISSRSGGSTPSGSLTSSAAPVMLSPARVMRASSLALSPPPTSMAPTPPSPLLVTSADSDVADTSVATASDGAAADATATAAAAAAAAAEQQRALVELFASARAHQQQSLERARRIADETRDMLGDDAASSKLAVAGRELRALQTAVDSALHKSTAALSDVSHSIRALEQYA